MCLAVYIATSKPLRTIPWNKAAPAFYLESVSKGESVCKQFAFPHVYYAGSHEGCGCGFLKDGKAGGELTLCKANYLALGRTLHQAMSGGARAEVFACWEGDQSDEPRYTELATPNEIEDPSFELKELQLLRVHESVA